MHCYCKHIYFVVEIVEQNMGYNIFVCLFVCFFFFWGGVCTPHGCQNRSKERECLVHHLSLVFFETSPILGLDGFCRHRIERK